MNQPERPNDQAVEAPYPPEEPLLNDVPVDEVAAAIMDGRTKICFDQMFVKAIAQSMSSIKLILAYEYVKVASFYTQILLVAIFAGIVYSANIDEDQNFRIWMIVIAGTLLTIVAQQYLHWCLKDQNTLLRASLATGHLLILPADAPDNVELTVYNAQAPEEPQPIESMAHLMESALSKAIMSYLNMTSRSTQKLGFLGQLFLIGSVVALIVSLSTDDLSEKTRWVTITFVVLECLVRIKYIIVLLFVALLPLLCIIFCCFACCKRNPDAHKFIEEQPVHKYKMATDSALQVDCVICYTSFAEDEDIIKLPCNQKHFFHDFCIKQWLKVSSTCPICRHDFRSD